MMNSKSSTFGFKPSSHTNITSKNAGNVQFKSIQGSGKRIPMVNMSSGTGDTFTGEKISGNSHNPIANAQRDGQPKDYRLSTNKRVNASGNKLESRKRNKGD